ncbi:MULTISPECIES: hypothetical protein [Corynebacterium]|nr:MULTISPECIES: hypothetical protein [Corynebacterium]MDK7883817.1 hypothetical protein [Corynebacterium striatum]MDK8811435.1 hypothetical protein [Corynebacterium striatum]MDK8843735.1 hypothetical protein [Corynebacterium striatum]VFB06240.1 Uncharacterised protein [Corynebacterium striatum]
MDLSMIQTHLDNFVATWEGWTKVLGSIGGVLFNSAVVLDLLSSK